MFLERHSHASLKMSNSFASCTGGILMLSLERHYPRTGYLFFLNSNG